MHAPAAVEDLGARAEVARRARSGGGAGSARRSARMLRGSARAEAVDRLVVVADARSGCRPAPASRCTSAACASLVSCISSTTQPAPARRAGARAGAGARRSSRTAHTSRSSKPNALQRSSSASAARQTAATTSAAGCRGRASVAVGREQAALGERDLALELGRGRLPAARERVAGSRRGRRSASSHSITRRRSAWS